MVDCNKYQNQRDQKNDHHHHHQKEISTLSELSYMMVCRRYVKIPSVINLFKYFDKMDWMIKEGPKLREKCITFIKFSYEAIKDISGKDDIIEVLGEDVVKDLEDEIKESQESIKRIKITGKVVEKKPSFANKKLTRSVSGNDAYEYESLKAGKAWPSGIDAKHRETYLDSEEFNVIFKMTFQDYKNLPSWKQLSLKKEKLLF